MGPTIIFDKSAIHSLGQKALEEVGRYFYTVVPPVLLLETLADLSLSQDDLEAAQKAVAGIANKVFPTDSIANEHYYTMCLHNLLGCHVPMEQIPAVNGAKPVIAKDGSKGLVINVQTEHEAVSRWRSGQFNSDDMNFAIQWRKSAKGAKLEEMKRVLPSPPIKMKTATEVGDFVDLLLSKPESQKPMLAVFLSTMKFVITDRQKMLARWQQDSKKMIALFAPYAHHCLRVQLIFYIGMQHDVFGTRSSNVVDLEYLFYSPFASVFCSGDKLHTLLAPAVLAKNQSFIQSVEMNKALKELAIQHESNPSIEPASNSLIQTLWQKHLKKEAKRVQQGTFTKDQISSIMRAMKPIMDAIVETKTGPDERPRFPV
jgi:hypothetical protein